MSTVVGLILFFVGMLGFRVLDHCENHLATPTPLPKGCRPAPEFGPDAIVCDGGGPPGWNVLPIRLPMLSKE